MHRAILVCERRFRRVQVRLQLGFERVSIVGFSMGAGVAAHYAALHPTRVARLALVDYAPRNEDGGVERLIASIELSWPSFEAAVDQMCAFNARRTRANIVERLSHSLRCDTSVTPPLWRFKIDPALVRAMRERVKSADVRDDGWSTLARIEAPTLVVRGAQSELFDAATAARVCSTLRRASLVTIDDSSHTVPGDQPIKFAAAGE